MARAGTPMDDSLMETKMAERAVALHWTSYVRTEYVAYSRNEKEERWHGRRKDGMQQLHAAQKKHREPS